MIKMDFERNTFLKISKTESKYCFFFKIVNLPKCLNNTFLQLLKQVNKEYCFFLLKLSSKNRL